MRWFNLSIVVIFFVACGGSGTDPEPTTDVGGDTPSVDTTVPDVPDPPPDVPPVTQDPVWTLDLDVPSAVAGKNINHFGGFTSLGQHRLYFCGDGGLFRVRVNGAWSGDETDVSSSATIKDCHAVGDDLMAAVGDDGKFWMWVGAENWLSDDIFETAPGLRGVHISKATSITLGSRWRQV